MTDQNTDTTPTEQSEPPSVHDHRAGKQADAVADLRFPFDGVPEGEQVIEIAEGILWVRLPLPWALDHINVYLLDEGEGWTVIDTGSQGKRGMALWEWIEKTVLDGRPILNVLATHMHPDHLGLAGWLVQRHGAEFLMSQAEYFLGQVLWMEEGDDVIENALDHLFAGGVKREYEPMIRAVGSGHYRKGVSRLPQKFTRLEDGQELTLGRRRWLVVIGRGHSPEHVCLHCLDEPLFVSGDQVLPEITSNVSVHAREPNGNPLAQWITSKERLLTLPGDPLVLPAHGPVFKGFHHRVSTVVSGHFDRLERLHANLADTWHSPVQTFRYLFRRKVSGIDFFLALGEARAHLNLLASLDLLEYSKNEGVDTYRSKGTFDRAAVREGIYALPGQVLSPLRIPA